MGLFSGMKAVLRANETLKRIEFCIEMLECHINSGNYAQARTYCNEAASRVRIFIEIVERSKTAEVSVYSFKGQKFKVMQLVLMFNEALQSANAIITHKGY